MKRSRLNVFLAGLLGLAIVGMLNYIASRHYARADWTTDSLFTLSPRTQQVLRDLDQDVKVYVFLAEGEQDYGDVQTLLEEYLARTDRISVEWVDPDRDGARYQMLAQRLGIESWSPGPYTLSKVPIVVTSGGRKWKIERHELIAMDFDSFEDPDGSKLDVQSERALTGAILQVTGGEPTVVCLAQGHGEWRLDAVGENSVSALARELQWQQIKVRPVELRGDQVVPESCHALFVIGPQRPFEQRMVEAVDSFLGSGGHVLLALDPVMRSEALRPTGFEDSLAQRGIVVNRDLVVETDPTRLVPGHAPDSFFVTTLGSHPLTDTLRQHGGMVQFAIARSVEAQEGSDAEVLMQSSPLARAETDLREAVANAQKPPEEEKPVPLGVAWEYVPPFDQAEPADADEAQKGAEPGRLVVLGDADWLTPQFLENPLLSNSDLLSSVVSWLTKREVLVDVEARQTKARPFVPSDQDLLNLFFRVVLLLPLASVITGFGVWWSRRT